MLFLNQSLWNFKRIRLQYSDLPSSSWFNIHWAGEMAGVRNPVSKYFWFSPRLLISLPKTNLGCFLSDRDGRTEENLAILIFVCLVPPPGLPHHLVLFKKCLLLESLYTCAFWSTYFIQPWNLRSGGDFGDWVVPIFWSHTLENWATLIRVIQLFRGFLSPRTVLFPGET